MAKASKKPQRQPRKQVKQKTGFEKLVELKNSAKQKKVEKLSKYGPVGPQGKKETKVVTAEDIGKKIAKKMKKKSLFDIESDEEEQVKHMKFVEETDDLAKTEKVANSQDDLVSSAKSKKKRYKEMIQNSKRQKYEKSKTLEEQREVVDELNADFDKIAEKLVFSAKEQVRKDANGQFNSYYSLVNSMKQQELLKAAAPIRQKPLKEENEEKVEDSEASHEENHEEDDEEEIEKHQLRGHKEKQQTKDLEDTLQNLKGILKNHRTAKEEEEEEYSDDEYGNCDVLDDDDEDGESEEYYDADD